MTLRAVIADDEAPARRALRRALADLDGIDVVGEAGDGAAALELVGSLAPDLLFLDIRMPGMSGLDVAGALRGKPGPAVIFVTAYDEHAVQAFEQAALDYIVKPVHAERVAESVSRVRQQSAPRVEEVIAPDGGASLLRVGGSLRVVEHDTVRFLEAAGNYVRVHAVDGSHLVRGTLTSLIERLGDELVRVHRSYAVRLSEVVEIRRPDNNDPTAFLRGGDEIPIGRTYWPGLEDRFS